MKRTGNIELHYVSILDISEGNVLAKPDGIDGMISIANEKFPTDRQIEIGDIYIWDMETGEVVFDKEETEQRRTRIADLLEQLKS